jgi:hypothetical protein
MHLATTVAAEAHVDPQSVMLLRHGNRKTAALLREGGTLEEFTLVQVKDSKYDFLATGKHLIEVVIAIVNDRVHFIYKVAGVERTGTTRSLTSKGFNRFDIAAGFPELPAKRFRANLLHSRTTGLAVSGWNSPRNAVAKYGSKTFNAVTCL